MKFFLTDKINALYQVSSRLKNKEQIYILSGNINEKNEISLNDYFEIENYIVRATEEHLEIDKKYLYACLKTISDRDEVCVILHTHPLQDCYSLKESEYDLRFFYKTTICWEKMSKGLPIIFGILCEGNVVFKTYDGNLLSEVPWGSLFDKYDECDWDLKAIYNQKYQYGILCCNKSKEFWRESTQAVKRLDEWIEKYEQGELTQLQELAYKTFIMEKFDVAKKLELVSEDTYCKTGVVNELQFMVQLGCNLNCKYCYAHGGTYNYGQNLVLEPESGIKIVDALIGKGVHTISKVTFIGGEPSMFPETIGQVCRYMHILYETERLRHIPRFYMVTNGVCFTEELFEYIKKYNIKITISVDGGKKINDELRIHRNGKGTYDEVKNTINKLKKQGTEPVTIEATYTSLHEDYNITRMEVIDTLRKETGVKTVLVADCEGEYAPRDEKSDESSKVEIEKDVDELYCICKMCDQACRTGIFNDEYCAAGYQNMAVLGNGEYYPCHRFVSDKSMALGNLFADDELRVLTSVNKVNNPKCVDCWAVNFCKDCNWNVYKEGIRDCKVRLQIIQKRLLYVYNMEEMERKRLETVIKG